MPKVSIGKSGYREETEEYEREIFSAIGKFRYKQKDLAKKLQKSQPTISSYLRNIDEIRFGDLRLLASILNLKISIEEVNDDEKQTLERKTT